VEIIYAAVTTQALLFELQALRCSQLSQVTAHNFITTQLRQSFLATNIVLLYNVSTELEAFIEQRREANYEHQSIM
jgi:hypothetical protein